MIYYMTGNFYTKIILLITFKQSKRFIIYFTPSKKWVFMIANKWIYDIRDILVKAKDEKIVDNGTRSFRNIEYNILKNIDVKNINEKKSADALEKTLSRTSFLDEIKDQDLCLDMLSDLRSSGDTIADKSSGVQDLLREVSEAKDKYDPKSDSDDNLDKSFYTSSLNFKEDDFEHLKDIQDSIDSNNKMIKVLFSLLVIVILAVIGFVIFKFL